MELVDTHCHIHFPDYALDPEEVLHAARSKGVKRAICVGCTLTDSKLGVAFARRHKNVWASVGIHPHESSVYVNDHIALQQLRELATADKVVAVGEIGLDYHYMHSPKADQKKLLRFQLDIAAEHGLPAIFHIREAFDDFWRIFDRYSGISGVVHSFSAAGRELDAIMDRGLMVGLNGIMTFTKDKAQLEAAKAVPLDKLVLETDAPFLTPTPYRGKICEPKHVRVTAEFLAELRGEDLGKLAAATTRNAKELFNLQ